MLNGHSHRLTELFGTPDTAAPRPRTAAQIEAARRNGAHSRGPVTAAGKAVARANALAHGLFAKVVAPPGDSRGYDLLYRQIYAKLVAEFHPSTFTAEAEVDFLAADLLRAARCRELIEAAMPCPTVSSDDLALWQQGVALRADLRVAEQVRRALEEDQPLACTAEDAATLAARLIKVVDTLLMTLAEAAADAVTLHSFKVLREVI